MHIFARKNIRHPAHVHIYTHTYEYTYTITYVYISYKYLHVCTLRRMIYQVTHHAGPAVHQVKFLKSQLATQFTA